MEVDKKRLQLLIILSIVGITAGLLLNVYAIKQFESLKEFEQECNEHYQAIFDQVCVPQRPEYGIDWDPLNFTINLTTSFFPEST